MIVNIFFTFQGNDKVDIHPFPYLIEPIVCTSKQPMRVAFYMAMPSFDVVNRKMLRDAWTLRARKYDSFVIFICGIAPNEMVAEQLRIENTVYGDILQVDTEDR